MSCGITEEELEELEAQAAAGQSTVAAAVGDGAAERRDGCGNGACDSTGQCSNKQDAGSGRKGSWTRCGTARGGAAVDGAPSRPFCMKCKTVEAVALVRQREPLCGSCLELGVAGKVRALKVHRLLLPPDSVAVALSGGCCSAALLAAVVPMRKDSSTPRKERGKIEFDLHVIHVDESSAYGVPRAAAEAHVAAVLQLAASCVEAGRQPHFGYGHQGAGQAGAQAQQQQQQEGRGGEAGAGGAGRPGAAAVAPVAVHVVPLSDVFREDWGQEATGELGREEAEEYGHGREAREARLQELLKSVPDPTGRDDLVAALRQRLLVATAARLRAAKLLRGDGAGALATRVIAETAKGRGFSLPSDIQLVDCRAVGLGEPAVLYPMREVTTKEAAMLCRVRRLPLAQLPYLPPDPRRSINSLAAAFIESLQASLPSTLFTVLRTASSLRPFPFNSSACLPPTPGAAAGANGAGAAAAAAAAAAGAASGGQRSEEVQGDRAGGEQAVRVPPCCALCRAPLSPAEVHAAARRRAAAAAGPASGADTCTAVAAAAVTAAAAAVSADDGSGAVEDGGHGVAQGQGAGGSACGGPGVVLGSAGGQGAGAGSAGGIGAEGGGAEGDGEDEEDTGAGAFCASCRTQIFFTPAQAAVMAGRAAGREGVGGVVAHGAPAVDERLSRVLPLLPPCMR